MHQKAHGYCFNLHPRARGNVAMPSIVVHQISIIFLHSANEREEVTYPSLEGFDVYVT